MQDNLLGYIDDKTLAKAMRFCAYQERCQQEMRDKLYSWELHSDEVEKIITKLIRENFINEERFAIAYAGGKFRMNQWGKIKIKRALSQKKISDYCINKALNQLGSRDYNRTLAALIEKQLKKVSEKNPLKKNYKIAQHLISKGYEPDLIWDILRQGM